MFMSRKKNKDKPLVFIVNDKALANQEISQFDNGYHMIFTYDLKGSLTRVTSKSGEPPYYATLTLNPEVPEAWFRNSYGDSSHWKNGIESSDATYGPYEQSSQSKISYEEWVQNYLIIMCGRNTE